jgi:hypothetical protein
MKVAGGSFGERHTAVGCAGLHQAVSGNGEQRRATAGNLRQLQLAQAISRASRIAAPGSNRKLQSMPET